MRHVRCCRLLSQDILSFLNICSTFGDGIYSTISDGLPGIMILGPVSLLDCVVFVLFLIPNLLVLVGPLQTLSLIKVIPFLGIATFFPLLQVSIHSPVRVEETYRLVLTVHQSSNCHISSFENGTYGKEKHSHHLCRMQLSSKTLLFVASDTPLQVYLQGLIESSSPNGSLYPSSVSAYSAMDISQARSRIQKSIETVCEVFGSLATARQSWRSRILWCTTYTAEDSRWAQPTFTWSF